MSLSKVGESAFDAASTGDADRLPPQDVHAESSVLGSMMLSKDAIADCIEVVRGADFYRPSHEIVYDAIIDLYGRGEPADAITVADELGKRNDLARIGGQSYLHELISSVPTAANASYYAEIVAERAVLRRLVNAGTKIVQLGYGQEGGDVEEIVNAAQAEVYAVADKRGGEDYVVLGDLLEAAADEIDNNSGRSGELVGVPTGFTDLDELTNGLHPGQMIVIAARPAMGKSTLALDIARAAAIHNGLAAVVFSLEMSRNEITMRLLSAEAGIQLQHMRKGTMRDEDWVKLTRTMGEVSEAPLFIDDSPNMSLMEIRAKCRRLKQRHNLKLVIIDYLQLMSSGKRVESRQQEVSEFSRALKLLAKEIEVPVIALSQLNRGPEQRQDKKPQVSDLRESGCLTADTRVLRADTGAEVTLGHLFASGAKDVPVWALDDKCRYVVRPMTHVFSTGIKPVYRLTTSSGKTVRATENHPFLTYSGWSSLGQLVLGERIAVPRHVPTPEVVDVSWQDAEVVDLAVVVSGHVDALLPAAVFSLPKRQIALFCRSFFSFSGGVTLSDTNPGGEIFAFADERSLLDSVSRLLLRFGIEAVISGDESGWVLDVVGVDSQRRFLQEIGIEGPAADDAGRLLEIVRDVSGARGPGPGQLPLWGEVAEVLKGEDPVVSTKVGVSAPLGRVVSVLDAVDMDLEAVNDVAWEVVTGIELCGEEEVFDATVVGAHNFVADGIAVHNSIEQDADMVMLLHRESVYEPDSPREGEADIIVAKHRNGPTATITVAFQGHFSRFTNMATNF
ncbi:replicative DNA helicase [Dermatophilus congolensis]|uniref:replicative DNA helicase n=1 Tax=Dermatophilus congolensis TaxID=1863 RepID=UPI001AAFA860|nr:replicative DNA helicase [Dermatophilus congolensis]MBO3130866.1 replicative DNA helicase [Dermatophilus congolensis]MBO3134976.1 replicative DNA helicase [Dermatophilus congolensis]MBO3137215.1 replicative DNA helicase [Dermatophilus congolensis]MBO3139458.1 replicative DNA helicase [Dermatophilus congolensis]